MAKKTIKLTESDIKGIIKNSVEKIIKEGFDEVLDTPEMAIHAAHRANDVKKEHPGRGKNSPDPAIRARKDRQIKAFGSKAADLINQEMDDPDFMAIGDRGARRMMYSKGPNSAYLTHDVDDLDSTKVYNDNYQEGDEPMTIADLPEDERQRIADRFEKFKSYHQKASELDENKKTVKMNESQLRSFIAEAVKNAVNEIMK